MKYVYLGSRKFLMEYTSEMYYVKNRIQHFWIDLYRKVLYILAGAASVLTWFSISVDSSIVDSWNAPLKVQ